MKRLEITETKTTSLRHLLLGVVVLSVLVGSTAHAQLPAGYGQIGSVVGVTDNGTSKTYFSCMNAGITTANVNVEIIDDAGTSLNGGTLAATALSVASAETRFFGTSTGGEIPIDGDLGVFNGVVQGEARIIASPESARLLCSAWVSAAP